MDNPSAVEVPKLFRIGVDKVVGQCWSEPQFEWILNLRKNLTDLKIGEQAALLNKLNNFRPYRGGLQSVTAGK